MTQPPTSWTPPGRPDIAGGTHAPGPERYTSPILRAHGEAIAAAITERFYRTWPELYERYKERGRQHTYEDQFWHLSNLDTAMRLESMPVWLQYVGWLKAFLAGRGMGDEIAGANFVWLRECLNEVALESEQEPERKRLLDYVDQAVALFPPCEEV